MSENSIPFFGLRSIAYGNSRFVAVGTTNIVASENIAVPGLSVVEYARTNLTFALSGDRERLPTRTIEQPGRLE
ncbi:MAG TPA: hypothetical protein VK633_14480 [Verrucomicrobiae bacterium]|nr:hypothetical protein [Verrucomicrobiae bacterium]